MSFFSIGKIFGAVLLASVLAGCQTLGGLFSDDESIPPSELVEFTPTLNVSNVWSTNAVDGVGRSRPAIGLDFFDEKIWAADESGRVVGLNAQTGRVEARFDTGLSISAGPRVEGEHLLVGTFDGEVALLDRTDGSVVWKQNVSSEVLAAPIVSDGKVIARVLDGRIYGFDRATGRRDWVYDRSVPLLTLRGNSTPIARAGRVYIGFDDGVVIALRSEDGQMIWEQRVSEPEGRTELERMTDIDGPMAIVGTELYVVSYKGRMASLALESGRLLWVKDVSAEQGVSLRRTELAVADRDDAVWLVDRRNSTTLWRDDRLERRDITRPVFYNNFLVTTDFEGYMHWLDAESGDFVARTRIGGDPAQGAPLVIGNTLYVLDIKGRISAWQARP
ncbi:MAG TPA: outer membrane protein assembly factor BamB [Wenzhouxiangella sp.]